LLLHQLCFSEACQRIELLAWAATSATTWECGLPVEGFWCLVAQQLATVDDAWLAGALRRA
jgi:hypothetical protein